MGLTQNAPKTYLKVKAGKIVISIQSKDEQKLLKKYPRAKLTRYANEKNGTNMTDFCFDRFSGKLVKIRQTAKNFNGEDVKFWEFVFADGNDTYIISMLYDSMTFQSIANSLASIEGEISEYITFIPYAKKNDKGADVTYVSVRYADEKLNWKYSPDELPAGVPLMTAKGKPYIDAKTGKPKIDYAEKIDFFESVVSEINSRCTAKEISNGNANSDEEQEPEYAEEPAEEVGF